MNRFVATSYRLQTHPTDVFRSMQTVERNKLGATHRITFPIFVLLAWSVFVVPRAVVADAGDTRLAAAEDKAFQQAIALVEPSVVRIETVGGIDRLGRFLTNVGATTGVIVSEDGLIITSAFNFVSKPSSIVVLLPDGRRVTGRIVAHDHARQLTLLAVKAEHLTPASAAPKKSIRVGQWAIALGRTYDNDFPNVSVGIVSALNRIWGKAIQTDAKVSPVNYGGPLIDIQGKVLGILVPLSPRSTTETAGVEWYDSGIGFAIPLEDIHASLARLKKGKDLFSGLLGIRLKTEDLYAGEAIIDRVRYNSPAQKAGLMPGDLITAADGTQITRPAQLRQILGSKLAGEDVEIVVRRDGKSMRKRLTLVAELEPYESAFLGILPSRNVKSPSQGVRVRFVFPNSPAEKIGLKRQDRITQFQGTDVRTSAALADLISRLRPGQTTSLTFQRLTEAKETDSAGTQVDVTLDSIPEGIPASVPAEVISSLRTDVRKDQPKTGRFVATDSATKRKYWAYVPDDYNPNAQYGLIVWVHPAGNQMEARFLQLWKGICDLRGFLILALRAEDQRGWSLNEAEILKKVVEQFLATYSVDSQRIVIHGYSTGGHFATRVAFKYRELFHGLILTSSSLAFPIPENRPEFRLQILFVCGDEDEKYALVQQSADALRRMKFAVSFRTLTGHGGAYPGKEVVREMGRWADMLDRI